MKKTKHVISCIVEYQMLGKSRGEPKFWGHAPWPRTNATVSLFQRLSHDNIRYLPTTEYARVTAHDQRMKIAASDCYFLFYPFHDFKHFVSHSITFYPYDVFLCAV